MPLLPPFHYRVYGLHIGSNQPIPGLIPKPAVESPDVLLEMMGAGAWTFAPIPDTLLLDGVKQVGNEWHSLKVWNVDGSTHVRYTMDAEIVDFVLNDSASTVDVAWSNGYPANDIPAFFLGPVIGCILRIRGTLALHAGVVAIGSSAVAIVGVKSAGKSTLVAEFARLGYPILSDDVAPVIPGDNQFWVQPGYPRLRVWPATLEQMGIASAELPRVESIFEKRYFDLNSNQDAHIWRFCSTSMPLKAVYELTLSRSAPSVSITATGPSQRLNALLQHSYADYVLDKSGRYHQFQQMAAIAAQIPVYSVQRPDDLSRLPETCQALIQKLHEAMPSP